MSTKGWTQHPIGQTQVFPVTGWKTASAMKGKGGALRIEYATEPTMQKQKAQQYLLSPTQVRALSEALAKLADKLEQAAEESPDSNLTN